MWVKGPLSTTSAMATEEMTDAEIEMLGRELAAANTVGVPLRGMLRWYSGATGRDQVKPLGQCVLHMFNHQAHHRGQVHGMVTAAGGVGWTSDLAFMPDEGRWP